MVEVNGISLEDVGAVGCCRIDVLVDFAGVEWCVVVVAYGEGNGVGSWWLKACPPTHQVLR